MKFFEAINNALILSMKKDKKVICFGLGVNDPKRIFNTTNNLVELFGEERVFDVPTSENSLTGIGVGCSILGFKTIMIHQRLDFFLLAMDQLVNSAAKWSFMFGNKDKVPITIRLILGRGWGQGPTHSQNLQTWFAHIPGLKVVVPSNPYDAKGLLISSIFDKNPVIFLEHRWLHNSTSKNKIPKKFYKIDIGSAKVIEKGEDLTIIASSYMVNNALKINSILKKNNIFAEIIDLRSLKPIDWKTIIKSVKKTKKVLLLETTNKFCSISSEIVSYICENIFYELKLPPKIIALPDMPEPTSYFLTKYYYPSMQDILTTIFSFLGKKINVKKISKEIEHNNHHDVPGDWFNGPF